MNLSSLLKENRRTAKKRSNSSSESPILSVSVPASAARREGVNECLVLRERALSHRSTHAAKMSARSAYCQYSKFGIGSSKDAGRERRLISVSTSIAGAISQVCNVFYTDKPIISRVQIIQQSSGGCSDRHMKHAEMRKTNDSLAQKPKKDLDFGFFTSVSHLRKSCWSAGLIDERLNGWKG